MDIDTKMFLLRVKADLAGEGNILGNSLLCKAADMRSLIWYKNLIEGLKEKGVGPEDIDHKTLEAI